MSKAPLNILFILSLLFALSGCAHRMRIETVPSGASVSLNDLELGESPLEVNTLWIPFQPLTLKVDLPGYRTQYIDVGPRTKLRHIIGEFLSFRFKRLLGLSVRQKHQIILIRKHKQAGTWLPDDAYRLYK